MTLSHNEIATIAQVDVLCNAIPKIKTTSINQDIHVLVLPRMEWNVVS